MPFLTIDESCGIAGQIVVAGEVVEVEKADFSTLVAMGRGHESTKAEITAASKKAQESS